MHTILEFDVENVSLRKQDIRGIVDHNNTVFVFVAGGIRIKDAESNRNFSKKLFKLQY